MKRYQTTGRVDREVEPNDTVRIACLLGFSRHVRPAALVLSAAAVLLASAAFAADVGATMPSAQLVGTATPTRTASGTVYPSTPGPARTPNATSTVPDSGPPGATQSVTSGDPSAQSTPTATSTAGPDSCAGDEALSMVPQHPRAGNDLFIVVTSAHRHSYPRLAGTEKTTFIGERPGQLGIVWEWSLSPTWPGRHDYTFYIDGTIPCLQVSFSVEKPLATSTPRTQSLDSDNGSDNADNGDNSDNSDNSSDNDSDNDASSTSTPIVTVTSTPWP